MHRYCQILTILFFTILLHGCSSYQSYYFENLRPNTTKVYKFMDENDPEEIAYWEISTSAKGNIMNTNTYDKDFSLTSEFYEKITKKGAKLIRYVNYYDWVEGPIEAEIVEDGVFSWNEENTISYKVRLYVQQDTVYITKTRQFVAYVDFEYENRIINVKQFEDTYSLEVNGKSYDDSYHVSYYAKDIGIVQFNTHLSNQASRMKLTDILNLDEFQKLKFSSTN